MSDYDTLCKTIGALAGDLHDLQQHAALQYKPVVDGMRQFYETYAGDKKVTPLVTQLPFTHNLIIMTQSKRPQEREFYLRMAIQERWDSQR